MSANDEIYEELPESNGGPLVEPDGVAVLLFDLYGLFMCNQTPEHQRELIAAAGASELDPADFWHAYRAERHGLDAGTLSDEDYWLRVFARLGLPSHDPGPAIAVDTKSWMAHDPTMVAMLAELAANRRPGLTIGLLSNITETIRHAIEPVQAWLDIFDFTIYSHETGLAKPQPEVYALAVERAGVAPSQILFIDDNQDNITAARAAGLRAEFFLGHPHMLELLGKFATRDEAAARGEAACAECAAHGDHASETLGRSAVDKPSGGDVDVRPV